jgi:hypothetical protein
MRTALTLAAASLLLAACGSTPPADTGTQSEVINTPPPATTTTSAAAKILTWGDTGTSTGVDIRIDTPTVSSEPGPAGTPFLLLPITATNNTQGTATIAVTARAGQQEVDVYDGPNGETGKFLPGETGTYQRRLAVPAGTRELVLQVYANIDQAPTENRLAFKGPLP